jgi:hypothetical protein
MTKLRPPVSIAHAITRIADVVDYARMGELVDRSERTVRDWSDPGRPTCPTLDQAIILDIAFRDAGGDGLPLLEYFHIRLQLATPGPSVSNAELVLAAGAVAREAGEAVQALIHAAQPGATHHDRIRAKSELHDASAIVTAAIGKIDNVVPDTG